MFSKIKNCIYVNLTSNFQEIFTQIVNKFTAKNLVIESQDKLYVKKAQYRGIESQIHYILKRFFNVCRQRK